MDDITVSDSAKERLNQIHEEMRYPCDFRLSVKGSGCSGLMYVLEPDSHWDGTDHRFTFDRVTVVVDIKSMKYIAGTEIDYVAEGVNTLFKFNNPNVIAHCGCGESFNVTPAKVDL